MENTRKKNTLIKKPEDSSDPELVTNFDDFTTGKIAIYTDFVTSLADLFNPKDSNYFNYNGQNSVHNFWTNDFVKKILEGECQEIYFSASLWTGLPLGLDIEFRFNGNKVRLKNVNISQEKYEIFLKDLNKLLAIHNISIKVPVPRFNGKVIQLPGGPGLRCYDGEGSWKLTFNDDGSFQNTISIFNMPEFLVRNCPDCKNNYRFCGYAANHQFSDKETERIMTSCAFYATTRENYERRMFFCDAHGWCRNEGTDSHKCSGQLRVTTTYVDFDICKKNVWGDIYCDIHTPPGPRHLIFQRS